MITLLALLLDPTHIACNRTSQTTQECAAVVITDKGTEIKHFHCETKADGSVTWCSAVRAPSPVLKESEF